MTDRIKGSDHAMKYVVPFVAFALTVVNMIASSAIPRNENPLVWYTVASLNAATDRPLPIEAVAPLLGRFASNQKNIEGRGENETGMLFHFRDWDGASISVFYDRPSGEVNDMEAELDGEQLTVDELLIAMDAESSMWSTATFPMILIIIAIMGSTLYQTTQSSRLRVVAVGTTALFLGGAVVHTLLFTWMGLIRIGYHQP